MMRDSQRLETAPHWHMGKQQSYHKMSSTKLWSMEKVVSCMHEGERTSLWTSAELKLAFFQSHQHSQQSAKENTLMFCVISVAAILKANKVIK